MPYVQIRYADIPHPQGPIRLVRFPNEPSRTSAFFSGTGRDGEFLPDPNDQLPEVIREEVLELFKHDKLPLYFDSIEMVFFPPMLLPNQDMKEPTNFSSALIEDEDASLYWQEATLKAHYY
jgi:hypothetical protein